MEQLTIRQYLKQHKVSQADLAKELKVSDAAISKIIRNKNAISKYMQERLVKYFSSKNIEIVFTDPQLNKTKLEEKYENLSKAYDILQLKCLELIAENQTLRESMKQIIALGKYLEGIKGRKPRIEKHGKTVSSDV